MIEKEKTPVTSRGSNESAFRLEKLRLDSIKRMVSPSITFYREGVSINKPVTIPNQKKEIGGLRGEIAGWSKASRRRMRQWLLVHAPVTGNVPVGLTLTIPGPPVGLAEAKKLFETFSNDFCLKNGVGLCWRLEIQKRGAFHWHCLASVPADQLLLINGLYFRQWWFKCLEKLGRCDWSITQKNGKKLTQLNAFRGSLFGALEHAINVQEKGGRGAWLRYLQDHATKAKQEQIPEKAGRHWGVTGRKFFQESNFTDFVEFETDSSFYRFMRVYQRLCTPVMSHTAKRDRCPQKYAQRPFCGRALGWSSKRGSRGRSTWFSNPETVKRLVTWACR